MDLAGGGYELLRFFITLIFATHKVFSYAVRRWHVFHGMSPKRATMDAWTCGKLYLTPSILGLDGDERSTNLPTINSIHPFIGTQKQTRFYRKHPKSMHSFKQQNSIHVCLRHFIQVFAVFTTSNQAKDERGMYYVGPIFHVLLAARLAYDRLHNGLFHSIV